MNEAKTLKIYLGDKRTIVTDIVLLESVYEEYGPEAEIQMQEELLGTVGTKEYLQSKSDEEIKELFKAAGVNVEVFKTKWY